MAVPREGDEANLPLRLLSPGRQGDTSTHGGDDRGPRSWAHTTGEAPRKVFAGISSCYPHETLPRRDFVPVLQVGRLRLREVVCKAAGMHRRMRLIGNL